MGIFGDKWRNTRDDLAKAGKAAKEMLPMSVDDTVRFLMGAAPADKKAYEPGYEWTLSQLLAGTVLSHQETWRVLGKRQLQASGTGEKRNRAALGASTEFGLLPCARHEPRALAHSISLFGAGHGFAAFS